MAPGGYLTSKTTIDAYNRIAHEYADTHWSVHFWDRQYKEFEGLLHGKRLLDAGSGAGRDTRYFISKGYDVVSIDASSGIVDEARKRVPEGSFMEMDMTDMKFADGEFDGLWCCASLLHLDDVEARKALSEFKRVLNSNGVLFISVKLGSGGVIEKRPDGTERYFRNYGVEEIRDLISRYFKVVNVYTHSGKDGNTWISAFGSRT